MWIGLVGGARKNTVSEKERKTVRQKKWMWMWPEYWWAAAAAALPRRRRSRRRVGYLTGRRPHNALCVCVELSVSSPPQPPAPPPPETLIDSIYGLMGILNNSIRHHSATFRFWFIGRRRQWAVGFCCCWTQQPPCCCSPNPGLLSLNSECYCYCYCSCLPTSHSRAMAKRMSMRPAKDIAASSARQIMGVMEICYWNRIANFLYQVVK